MANYYARTRTNYFKVTDEEKLLEIIEKCESIKGTVRLYPQEGGDEKRFCIACEGTIDGFSENDDDPSYDFDGFTAELAKILPDGEAIIFTEIGHEKLRYLTAYSIIVTNKGNATVDLESASVEKARSLLQMPGWNTRTNY